MIRASFVPFLGNLEVKVADVMGMYSGRSSFAQQAYQVNTPSPAIGQVGELHVNGVGPSVTLQNPAGTVCSTCFNSQ
jgi:hypothetical protein